MALLLSGCVARVLPAGPPLREPALLPEAWIAADGAVMKLRCWSPVGPARAVILALHGFGDYAVAFAPAGPGWAEAGFLVLAPDQRGHGANLYAGIWPGSEALVADATALIRLVADAYPGLPLILAGESMGGAIAVLAALDAAAPLAGVVLLSPALQRITGLSPMERGALTTVRALVPGLYLNGSGLPFAASDNLEALRAMALDPLIVKQPRADAVAGLVDLMDRAALAADQLAFPYLLLTGGHEQIVPGPRDQALAALPSRLGCAIRYPDGWHLLLRDRQGAQVTADITRWIDRLLLTRSAGDDPAGTCIATD